MNIDPKSIIIIGAGVTGLSLAWHLQNLGYMVKIVDPCLDNLDQAETASFAAIGMLMGNTYNNKKGRSWQLRQRGFALWPQWRTILQFYSQKLIYRPGLLFLASNISERNCQKEIILNNIERNISLLNDKELNNLEPNLPGNPISGLLSLEDGQINAKFILTAFYLNGIKKGVQIISKKLTKLIFTRNTWQIEMDEDELLYSRWVILCTGGSVELLSKQLRYNLMTEYISGQALQIEIQQNTNYQWKNWPGGILWKGNSLVPLSKNTYWLGTTLERIIKSESHILNGLINRNKIAPRWVKRGKIIRHWQGLRSRPTYRGSPILQLVAPGLIIANAYYRNGILLAPATAEWIAKCISIGKRAENS